MKTSKQPNTIRVKIDFRSAYITDTVVMQTEIYFVSHVFWIALRFIVHQFNLIAFPSFTVTLLDNLHRQTQHTDGWVTTTALKTNYCGPKRYTDVQHKVNV